MRPMCEVGKTHCLLFSPSSVNRFLLSFAAVCCWPFVAAFVACLNSRNFSLCVSFRGPAGTSCSSCRAWPARSGYSLCNSGTEIYSRLRLLFSTFFNLLSSVCFQSHSWCSAAFCLCGRSCLLLRGGAFVSAEVSPCGCSAIPLEGTPRPKCVRLLCPRL